MTIRLDPGSGKTRVLVHRIAYLIRARRENARGILALAYNRHAAVDIRRRLAELIGDDARSVTVLTCHALAMRLAGASFTGRAERPDDEMFQEVMRRAVELLRGEGLPPEEADEQRERLLAGFRWILVDEYQDIGPDQYELISALAGRTLEDDAGKLTLFAVGDDDQNIVHDDHVEAVGFDFVDAVGKGLHRGKDVATRVWTLAADQPLTKTRLAQDELEDLLALTQDLVAVRDEEQGTPHTLVAQPLEIECRNPGLAGAGRCDHEIAVVPAQALRFERLERNRLMRLRRDVDQQRQLGDVVGCAAAALSRERVVEPLGVTPGRIVLELGLLPILFEGRLESLDDLGVLGRAHTHVPFEALDLCRVGEI